MQSPKSRPQCLLNRLLATFLFDTHINMAISSTSWRSILVVFAFLALVALARGTKSAVFDFLFPRF